MIDSEEMTFAEKQVIGAILLGAKEPELLFTLLAPNDFFYQGHKVIFGAAKRDYETQGQYDYTKLMGLPEALTAFQDAEYFIHPGESRLFAQRIKACSRERRVKEQLTELMQADADTLLVEMQAILDREVCQGSGNYGSLSDQQMEQVLGEMEGSVQIKLVKTGMTTLDFITGGLRQGNISTWGAKPSTGKTALLLNILLHNAKQGKKTAFFSLEMSAAQLWERLLANACNLDYGDINHRSLAEAQKREYRNQMIELAKGGNIFLFDDVFTLEEQANVLYEIKPDFVVVDYLQLVQTVQKRHNRNEELGYIISRYKQLARKLNCHISLLSQFNRSGTAVREEGLSMFQFKDSGSIEDGSDYVFLLSHHGRMQFAF
ncbi:MAG: DnaB-like helicase C-terminal domain-containing protein [Clostridiales bacterium]